MVCEICRLRIARAFYGVIHLNSEIKLSLCFAHDIELFKLGQVGFIKRYEGIIDYKLKAYLLVPDED